MPRGIEIVPEQIITSPFDSWGIPHQPTMGQIHGTVRSIRRAWSDDPALDNPAVPADCLGRDLRRAESYERAVEKLQKGQGSSGERQRWKADISDFERWAVHPTSQRILKMNDYINGKIRRREKKQRNGTLSREKELQLKQLHGFKSQLRPLEDRMKKYQEEFQELDRKFQIRTTSQRAIRRISDSFQASVRFYVRHFRVIAASMLALLIVGIALICLGKELESKQHPPGATPPRG